MGKCYKLTRDDGEDFGTFHSEEEARTVGEEVAWEDECTIRWTKVFGGRTLGHGGRGASGTVHNYTITRADCE